MLSVTTIPADVPEKPAEVTVPSTASASLKVTVPPSALISMLPAASIIKSSVAVSVSASSVISSTTTPALAVITPV